MIIAKLKNDMSQKCGFIIYNIFLAQSKSYETFLVVCTQKGGTALHCAAESGYSDTVKLLLRAGATDTPAQVHRIPSLRHSTVDSRYSDPWI